MTLFVNLEYYKSFRTTAASNVCCSAHQRKHKQERPSEGFKAVRVAQLDRDSQRGDISDCRVTGGLQERIFMVIFSLLVNRRSSNKYVCSRYTCMPAFHFHSFLLIFVNLWPIYRHCVWPIRCMLWPMSFVADMVVADVVSGRYRRFPSETISRISMR